MYKDWKMSKDNFDENEYKAVSDWCKIEENHTIKEENGVYSVVKIEALSDKRKADFKRAERDNLLKTVVDPVVCNPLRWESLSEAEKSKYKAYRLYLLDIPQQDEFPDIEITPFDEFLK